MKKILILSPGLDQALAIARFIRKYGNGWMLHGGLLEGESFKGSKYYDKVVKVRDVKDFKKYDCVLPTGAKSTHWMITHVGDFFVNGILYSKKNLQYFDKYNIICRLSALGIKVPKTYKSIKEIDTYPVFYKPKFEEGGGPRGIAFSFEELHKLPEKHKLIFQEYIPGRTTYGVGFIAQDNKILTYFQHAEQLSIPIQGGSAVYIRRFNDERLLAHTQKIIEHLGFSGWGLAEFKYCHKRQDYVFMEINAKLWASIEFAILNNNKFLKYMFNIEHPENYIDSALYIERLIALGWPKYIQNIHYLFRSKKIIKYRDLKELLLLLAYNSVPPIVRRAIKKTSISMKAVSWPT